MRPLSFSHAFFASLLWCAATFALVGMNFTTYADVLSETRRSARAAALDDLQRSVQVETDKGFPLAQLSRLEQKLARYATDDEYAHAVYVFDIRSGKVLFGSQSFRPGADVDAPLLKECRAAVKDFSVLEKDKDVRGIVLTNPFNEKIGCLVAEYPSIGAYNVRQEMVKTAFNAGFRLCFIGIFAAFLIFCLPRLSAVSFLSAHKIYVFGAFFVVFGALIFSVFSGVKTMHRSFEADLKKDIALKAGIVTRIVQSKIEKAVENGVPFKAMEGVELYLDGLRRKNPEILFVLVTDKTGRVLYESGSAEKAFETDPLTGKTTLRDGYYNAAEPVAVGGDAVGWVQIGVNERFVREENI